MLGRNTNRLLKQPPLLLLSGTVLLWLLSKVLREKQLNISGTSGLFKTRKICAARLGPIFEQMQKSSAGGGGRKCEKERNIGCTSTQKAQLTLSQLLLLSYNLINSWRFAAETPCAGPCIWRQLDQLHPCPLHKGAGKTVQRRSERLLRGEQHQD